MRERNSCIFVGRADLDFSVRSEDTANCINARRHAGSRQLLSAFLRCRALMDTYNTFFAALCRADCAALCCAVLAVDARRHHARTYKKKWPTETKNMKKEGSSEKNEKARQQVIEEGVV